MCLNTVAATVREGWNQFDVKGLYFPIVALDNLGSTG
jgi:hypothetical protein